MKDKVVIFDMDGVLIDSEPAYKIMNKKLFSELGISMSDSSYHELVGMSSFKMWTMLKENFNLAHEVKELMDKERKGMHEILSSEIHEPVSGIRTLLENLEGRNFRLAVASSSPKENILLVLDKLKLKKFFEFVVSGDEVEHGKPSPDIFLKVAEHFKSESDDCFVIEDSSNGVKAALAAEMKVIGFRNQNSGSQDLSKSDLIIKDFQTESIDLILKFILNN